MNPKTIRSCAAATAATVVFCAGWFGRSLKDGEVAPDTGKPHAFGMAAKPLPTATGPDLKEQANSSPEAPPDPAASLEELAGDLSSPESRREIIAQFRQWADDDGARATEWADANLDGAVRVAALYHGVRAWSQQAPDDAAAWTLELRNDPVYDDVLQGLVSGWSAAPAEAADWLETVPDSEEAQNAASILTNEWSQTDPAAAAAWSVEYFEQTGSGAAFQRAIAAWAQQDLESARAFIETAPQDLQFEGYVPLTMVWASQDVASVAEWATSLEPGMIQNGALTQVVDAWARQSPKDAAAFVETIADDAARTSASRFLVQNWVDSNMIEVSEWLASLPQGEMRDESVAAFGDSLMDTDPERALDWSLTIKEEMLREDQIEDQLHSWIVRDEAAAAAWLEKNPVPAEIVDRVQGKVAGS